MFFENLSYKTIATFLCVNIVGLILSAGNAEAANTQSGSLQKNFGQYFSIDSTNSINITGSITVEMWIKIKNLDNTGAVIILQKGDGYNDAGYALLLQNLSSNDYRLWGQIAENGSSSVMAQKTGSTNLYNFKDQWVHIAMTWVSGSSNHVRLFVNGIEENPGTTDVIGASNINNNSDPLRIGAQLYNAHIGNFFDGLIDDVRIWNIARSNIGIANDMFRQHNAPASHLVANWELNGSLADASGNGNTLTANGGAGFAADTPFSRASTRLMKIVKERDESVISSSALHNDYDLSVPLVANKTYLIDGIVTAQASSTKPDIVLGFTGVPGITGTIQLPNQTYDMAQAGTASASIKVPADVPRSIHFQGTLTTGASAGDFHLEWAQANPNGAPTTVFQGSYIKAYPLY